MWFLESSPILGVTAAELQSHFGPNVTVSKNSCVVIDAPDCYIENFKFDGYVVIKGTKDTKIVLKDGEIKNKGCYFRKIEESEKESLPLASAIRGYVFVPSASIALDMCCRLTSAVRSTPLSLVSMFITTNSTTLYAL